MPMSRASPPAPAAVPAGADSYVPAPPAARPPVRPLIILPPNEAGSSTPAPYSSAAGKSGASGGTPYGAGSTAGTGGGGTGMAGGGGGGSGPSDPERTLV